MDRRPEPGDGAQIPLPSDPHRERVRSRGRRVRPVCGRARRGRGLAGARGLESRRGSSGKIPVGSDATGSRDGDDGVARAGTWQHA